MESWLVPLSSPKCGLKTSLKSKSVFDISIPAETLHGFSEKRYVKFPSLEAY